VRKGGFPVWVVTSHCIWAIREMGSHIRLLTMLRRPDGMLWQDTTEWVPIPRTHGETRTNWLCPNCSSESERYDLAVKHIAKVCKPWYDMKRRQYEDEYTHTHTPAR
jgi:hypothetical protein